MRSILLSYIRWYVKRSRILFDFIKCLLSLILNCFLKINIIALYNNKIILKYFESTFGTQN